jgi:disulfide bond formation protein DsbB
VKFISNLATDSRAWFLLSVSALGLEIVALYFQYVMGLNPCIMCIYQRTALWGVFFAGIVGSLGNQLFIIRLLAYMIWGVSSVWGLLIAIEHVDMQTSAFSFMYVCEIVPNFPQWSPLHEWLPVLFEANGDCGDINWQFLGLSMPQVMIAVFAVYSAILAFLLAIRLIKHKIP